MPARDRVLQRAADWILLPAAIAFLAYEPKHLYGWVDYIEIGQYLGPANSIFHGGVPYRDNFTLYGPLAVYVPALVMEWFGKSIAVLRDYFHYASILSLIAAYVVGSLVCRTRLFRYLIAIVCVVEAHHPYWSSLWGGFRTGIGLMTLGCLVLYVRHRRPRWLLAGGVFTGLSVLYSTEIGVFTMVTAGVLASWLLWEHRTARRLIIRDFLVYVAGVALVWVPMAWYLAWRGGLSQYLEAAFWVLPFHHIAAWGHGYAPSLIDAARAAPDALRFLASDAVKIYLPIVLYATTFLILAIRVAKRMLSQDGVIIMLFSVYGALQFSAAFRAADGTQFQMALPPLVIMWLYGLERCFLILINGPRPADHRRTRWVAVACVSALALSAGYFAVSEKRYYRSLYGWWLCQKYKDVMVPSGVGPAWWKRDDDWVRPRTARAGAIFVPTTQAFELDAVTEFLETHTAPGEPVLTFPEHGMINFLADRPPVSRFDIIGLACTTPAWQQEVLAAIQAHPPMYAVEGKPLSNLARSIHRREELFPEVSEYLKRHYEVVRDLSTVVILKRRSADVS